LDEEGGVETIFLFDLPGLLLLQVGQLLEVPVQQYQLRQGLPALLEHGVDELLHSQLVFLHYNTSIDILPANHKSSLLGF
jgi:hypothetical protein